MGNVMMEASQINYRGGAEKMSVEQALKETSGEAAAIAALQATKANQATIAPVFDATASYTVGDLVYYENAIYRCTTDHTGAWAAADFAATSVETEILRAAAVKADESDIAPAFDATATYEAGDLVYYNGTIYRCTNDHTGDWDATDFSATTIAGELNGLNSKFTDLHFAKISELVPVTTTEENTAINSIAGYSALLFVAKVNSTIRGSLYMPEMLFESGVDCYVLATAGNIYIKYVDATHIKIMGSVETLNYLDIYGIK